MSEEAIPFIVPSVEDVCSVLRSWKQALHQHRTLAEQHGWDRNALYKQNKLLHFGLVRIEQLAAVGDYPLKSVVMREVGDELVQFLEWDNIGLEESTAAVRCLWCLAIAHSTNKQLLGEKAMPRLVALLSHTSREMKKAAAQAVWSVCYSVTRNQQLALEHGALRPLLRLLCMEHQQQQQPPQYNEVPIDTSAIPTPQSTSGVAAEASVEQSAEAMDAAPPSPLRAADSPRRLLRRQSTTEETRNTRSVVDADTSSTPNQPPQTQHEAVPQQQQEEALVYPDEPSFRELRHAGAGALWHLSSYEAGRRQMVEEGALDPLRNCAEGRFAGDSPTTRVFASLALSNLALESENHADIEESQAVRPVGILLDELGPAASFDTGLVWTEVDSILKLVQQPPAVPYAEVRELGCWIVASIALQNNSKFAGRTKLLMEGAEELLQNALHYDTSVKVRLRAAEALLALGITNAVQPSEGRGVNQEEKADTPTEQEGDGPSAADSSKMCIVCCSRARDCALYRCGHVVVCSFCARILITGENPCPLCRAKIDDIVQLKR